MLLNFQTSGEGPALVLLHGLLGSSLNMSAVARALSARFRVFNLDQRNHGASFHSGSMTYGDMAADVLRLMDSLGLACAALLGHSLGGKTAMQTALAAPGRVWGLVVADIAPGKGRAGWGHLIEPLLEMDLDRVGRQSDADALLAARIPDSGVRRFLLQNLARDPQGRYSWRANLKAIARARRDLAAPVSGPPFQGPCLFIRGGDSPYIGEKDMGDIRRLFPRARLESLEGAGHWVHVEAKALFIDRVSRFLLASLPGPAAGGEGPGPPA